MYQMQRSSCNVGFEIKLGILQDIVNLPAGSLINYIYVCFRAVCALVAANSVVC